MNILAVDIGTGTQDVLYLNTQLAPANALQIVAPAPTLVVSWKIQESTRRGDPVVLMGKTMGGGPSRWAAEAHIRAGYVMYATPQAARSFDDDLDRVREEIGLRLVSEEEADALPEAVRRIQLADFDFQSLARSFGALGVELRPQAVLIAAFDHGEAPRGESDRRFRFQQLSDRLSASRNLSALAFAPGTLPAALTRLRAIEASASGLAPRLMLMDSGAAAVVGALLDPFVGRSLRPLVVNVGNFHVLGFRLRRGKSEGVYRVEGLFEHHTGFLDQGRLEDLLERLANGKLTNEEVFGSQGHGALVYDRQPLHLGGKESPVAVVGPRRDLMLGSRLHPFLAAPYGDMMLAGDYGLIRTAADQFADIRGEILHVLADPIQVAPWDVPRE